jgi:hypothetical protein
MKIKDLKELLASLPETLDDKDVVIREIGEFKEPSNEGMWFKKDMPIWLAYFDESTGELAFCDENSHKKHQEMEAKSVNESFLNFSEYEKKKQS